MRPGMPKQSPQERIKNFNPVALGLSEVQAVGEAKRCLQCKNSPCIKGCPVEIDIPAFIKLLAEGKFEQAGEKIKEKNNLPAICGRVCPQETQCELSCILGKKDSPIAIGLLERFAADWQLNQLTVNNVHQFTEKKSLNIKKRQAAKVAVVGSGPAGLTCAGDLAKMGYKAAVFESLHKPGGVLVYGIPEFRLPNETLLAEVDYLCKLGVELKTNFVVGLTASLDDLRAQGYEAFYIGSGAGLPGFMRIPGENLNGIYSANEYLTRVNLM
ncbi:MAG: NAD(P)-binding protein, partial [Candidatus Omnitrophica bacterium]|nr:NAD(P)-binding protein [Candidatus Omnitrophota bacterium]